MAKVKTLPEKAPESASAEPDLIMHESIYDALAAAQEEIPPIPKTKTNPEFDSKFADLGADILPVITPILRKHGLFLHWMGEVIEGVSVLSTVIRHQSSGDSKRCSIPLYNSENPHNVAKTITYYQRYGVCCLLGIVTEDDRDGNRMLDNPKAEKALDTPEDSKPQSTAKASLENPKDDIFRRIDMLPLDVDAAVALIKTTESVSQLNIVIDGLKGGEAWLDCDEREQILTTTKSHYKTILKSSGSARNRKFEEKMIGHDADLADVREMDRAAKEDITEE
jgi:hypothetical protein